MLLSISYPPAVHFALLSTETKWAVGLLVAVSFSQLLIGLLSHRIGKTAMVISGAVLALSLFSLVQGTVLALFFPPLFILSALFWFFARTLRPGREPIITRLARTVFQEDDLEVLKYTRRVTLLWSLFFLTLFIETVLLAIFAPLEVWSLFSNILNYLFIVLLFILEFSYRRLRFPQKKTSKKLLQQFAHVDWSELFRSQQ